jgi:hypothetical protein
MWVAVLRLDGDVPQERTAVGWGLRMPLPEGGSREENEEEKDQSEPAGGGDEGLSRRVWGPGMVTIAQKTKKKGRGHRTRMGGFKFFSKGVFHS